MVLRTNNEHWEQLHRDSIVVDAHCDTLTAMLHQKRNFGERANCGHLDLKRLKDGGINVQVFAAFISPEFKEQGARRSLELIDLYHREMEINKEEIIHIQKKIDLESALTKGKVAALLAVEGGEALQGSISVLRMLYRLGVRVLTLTWNGDNEIGAGVGNEGSESGLTPFGAKVVEEMNMLGMLVDISHLADKGFWDVIRVSKHPVIASHSNCRALAGHRRNLTDDQIKALSIKGGVMGINFVPDFLGGEKPSLDEVLDHIDHAINLGGAGCVGLGSDFDGTECLPEGIDDCTSYPCITQGLVERGYSDLIIKQVLGDNFLRVIGQVLK